MYACAKCRGQYEFDKARSVAQLIADGCAVTVLEGEVQSVVCPSCIEHERSMGRGVE